MVRRLYAIIGDPIGQARSPELFNARFIERGIDAEMVPLEVSSEGLSVLLNGLRRVRNFGGAVITVPHKLAAAHLAEERSSRVRIAGAANVLKPFASGWLGDLFDGVGFVAGVAAQGFAVEDRIAAIVGAGGAGLAIAAALLEANIRSIAIDDRDP
jgi:shikimate dehydrogenase